MSILDRNSQVSGVVIVIRHQTPADHALPSPKPRQPKGPDMSVRLGDTAPDFTADTTQGEISFHDWLGDSWGVLFSHPKDFTPVCTTELRYMAEIKPEFDPRGAKTIGLSVDPVENHS